MLTDWFPDRAHAVLGLSYLMPAQIDGSDTYTMRTVEGRTEFAFTKTGRQWAKKNLMRDPRRVRQALYGRRTKKDTPRFVQ